MGGRITSLHVSLTTRVPDEPDCLLVARNEIPMATCGGAMRSHPHLCLTREAPAGGLHWGESSRWISRVVGQE